VVTPGSEAEAGGAHKKVVGGILSPRGRSPNVTAREGELAMSVDVKEKKSVAHTGRGPVASIVSGGGGKRWRGTRGGGGRTWRER
jgi:hypothetical protein